MYNNYKPKKDFFLKLKLLFTKKNNNLSENDFVNKIPDAPQLNYRYLDK
jgi:hypothetical protein